MQCTKKQILILGSTGTLGRSFRKYWSGDADVFYGVRYTHTESNEIFFDMKADISTMEFHLSRFDIVINCAAITQVDAIETDPVVEEESKEVNWKAVERLSIACLNTDTTLIHFSTDYIFGNNYHRPYCEDDIGTGPCNKYGLHKWNAENCIKKSGCKYLIFRVSWLFSEDDGNFLSNLFAKMMDFDNKEVIYGATDIISSPTYSKDVVNAVCKIIASDQENKIGVYHLTNEGICTRYDFIQIMTWYTPFYNADDIIALDSCLFKAPAKRPKCSVMSKEKIKSVFCLNIRSWVSAVAECCEKIAKKYDR
jgi:dTDP-4-dehydrorhamnose reductase